MCFVKENEGDYLYSVVHEQMYGLDVNEEEGKTLME